MKVGDKVREVPETIGEMIDLTKLARRERTGTVIYVHPEGRFYTVAFACGRQGVPLRESFYPPERRGSGKEKPVNGRTEPRLPGSERSRNRGKAIHLPGSGRRRP